MHSSSSFQHALPTFQSSMLFTHLPRPTPPQPALDAQLVAGRAPGERAVRRIAAADPSGRQPLLDFAHVSGCCQGTY